MYYSPPAMRRHNQQQQQQSKLKSPSTSVPERRGFGSGSYLDRFLDNTTPAVAAQHFPRVIFFVPCGETIRIYVKNKKNKKH